MRVITIGRHVDNDVFVDDPCASRHHLQIIQHDDGHFSLADFGSTNGTFINGQQISGEVDLNLNDVVRIGNTTIPWRLYFEEEEVVQSSNSALQYDDMEAISSNPTIPKNLDELSKFSVSEINEYLAEGARFVRFTYVISIVVMTFKRESQIYFIRKDDTAFAKGWPYSLLSFLLGWWGIPFGPIYTIAALITNFKGRDVTEGGVEAMHKTME